MSYTRTPGGRIQTIVPLEIDGKRSDWQLILQAAGVRKNNTGVHATVTIAVRRGNAPATVLDEDLFNVERREDRNRLASSAAKNPLLVGSGVDKLLASVLQAELLMFTRGLWEYEIGSVEIKRRGGTVERRATPLLLDPFVVDGGGTILFAPPGRGKSFTGLIWAVLMDAGLIFDDEHGNPVVGATREAPVMFINLERGEGSVDDRLGNVNQALGLPRDRGIYRVDRRGWNLSDLQEAVAKAVQREGIQCVFLDSLTRGGFGDMNENLPANKAMDGLNALGVSWVALAHTSRADETHVFGSQMFDAAADVMCMMLTQEKGDLLGVGVKGTKANDIKIPPLRTLAYHFDGYGLDSVRAAFQSEFLLVETQGRVDDVVTALTKYVIEHGEVDATAAANALEIPRTTIAKLFSKSPDFVFVRKDGRKALYAVRSDRDAEQDVPWYLREGGDSAPPPTEQLPL